MLLLFGSWQLYSLIKADFVSSSTPVIWSWKGSLNIMNFQGEHLIQRKIGFTHKNFNLDILAETKSSEFFLVTKFWCQREFGMSLSGHKTSIFDQNSELPLKIVKWDIIIY